MEKRLNSSPSQGDIHGFESRWGHQITYLESPSCGSFLFLDKNANNLKNILVLLSFLFFCWKILRARYIFY